MSSDTTHTHLRFRRSQASRPHATRYWKKGSSDRSHATNAPRAPAAPVPSGGPALWPRSDEIAAPCVTAVKVPEGIDGAELRLHIRDRYGVVVSGAQGELVGKGLRLGHMGLASRSLYPLIAATALAQGLIDLGVKLDVGAAAEATLTELSTT